MSASYIYIYIYLCTFVFPSLVRCGVRTYLVCTQSLRLVNKCLCKSHIINACVLVRNINCTNILRSLCVRRLQANARLHLTDLYVQPKPYPKNTTKTRYETLKNGRSSLVLLVINRNKAPGFQGNKQETDCNKIEAHKHTSQRLTCCLLMSWRELNTSLNALNLFSIKSHSSGPTASAIFGKRYIVL